MSKYNIQPEVLKKVAVYLDSLGVPTQTSPEKIDSDTSPSISIQDIDPLSLNYLAEYVQRIHMDSFHDEAINDNTNERKSSHEDDSQQDHLVHVLSNDSTSEMKTYIDAEKLAYIKTLLSDISENDIDNLSPIENILLEELYRQNQKFERLQSKMDLISQLLSNDNNKTKITVINTDPDLERELPFDNGPEEENVEARIFMVLNSLFDKIMYIPRNIYRYLTNSRIYRLFEVIYQEAAEFQVPGNPNARFFDIHLMVKIAFACIFLNARMQYSFHSGNASGSILGEMIRLWKMHRSFLLIASGITVYFIQSGLAVFFFHIIFKERIIRKVWKDHDEVHGLPDNTHRNRQRHRGRRDRVPMNDIEEEDTHEARVQDQDEEPVRLPTIHEMVNESFLGGVIGRPNPNRIVNQRRIRFLQREEALLYNIMRGLIEGFLDALYLFGSFFLSLLPTWHPRPGPEVHFQLTDLIDAILNDDLEQMTHVLQKRPDFVSMKDENGWEPIHEAVRAGHIDCIESLISHSADINARTGTDNQGGSVLWWALRYHDNNSDLVIFLQGKGATIIAPGQIGLQSPDKTNL